MEDEDDFVLSSHVKGKRSTVPQQHPVDTSQPKRTCKPSQRAKDLIELSPDKGDSTRKNLPKKKVNVPALPEDISHPPDEGSWMYSGCGSIRG